MIFLLLKKLNFILSSLFLLVWLRCVYVDFQTSLRNLRVHTFAGSNRLLYVLTRACMIIYTRLHIACFPSVFS